MNWPDVTKLGLNHSVDFNQIIRDTLRQIEKDFTIQGLNIEISSTESSSYPDLLASLAQRMEEVKLIEHARFPSLLYQLDLNQSTISQRLTQSDATSIYSNLADSIIKKCFEKVCWRQRFKD